MHQSFRRSKSLFPHTRAALRILVATAACAGCVALAACGGGGTSNFVAKANAICTHDAAAAVATTRTPARNTQVATEQVKALVAARESALEKLRALTPPNHDRASYGTFLAEWPRVESAWRSSVSPIAKGAAAYNAGGAATPALDATQRAAGQVGLAACAGELPHSDATAITSFIRRGELSPTASVCTQQTTKRFLAVSGGLSACLQSTKTRSAQVRISGLHGTAPIASAHVSRAGGNQPGGSFVFWVVKLGGRWQLDDAY